MQQKHNDSGELSKLRLLLTEWEGESLRGSSLTYIHSREQRTSLVLSYYGQRTL